MSIEDKMTIDERRKYLRKMQERYLQAGLKEGGQLLGEMETVTDLHRKSLIRLMKGSLARQPRRRQPTGQKWMMLCVSSLRAQTTSVQSV